MYDSIEVIWSFMIDYPTGWGVRQHAHDYFQMYYCTSGCGTMLLGDEKVELAENSCVMIHADQNHVLYPIKQGRLQVIDTKFYVHDEAIRNALLQIPQLCTNSDTHFRELQQATRNEWGMGGVELRMPRRCPLLYLRSLFFCFCGRMFQHWTGLPFTA